MESNSTKGGKRPGAGRKPANYKRETFSQDIPAGSKESLVKFIKKLRFVHTVANDDKFGLWKHAAIESITTNREELFVRHIMDQYDDPQTKQNTIHLFGKILTEI